MLWILYKTENYFPSKPSDYITPYSTNMDRPISWLNTRNFSEKCSSSLLHLQGTAFTLRGAHRLIKCWWTESELLWLSEVKSKKAIQILCLIEGLNSLYCSCNAAWDKDVEARKRKTERKGEVCLKTWRNEMICDVPVSVEDNIEVVDVRIRV
jgi:hypothetical protein